MSLGFKIIDNLVNRLNRRYRGLSPRNAKQFSISLFEYVGKDITSVPELVQTNICREIKGLSFANPLVIYDKNTKVVAKKKVITPYLSLVKNVAECEINSNHFDGVKRIIEQSLKFTLGKNGLKICSAPGTSMDKKYGGASYGYKRFDLIYGVGGGTVVDVAKYAAYKMNLPFIAVPTSLSNDGFASPFSVLGLGEDGVATLSGNTPLGVVVDVNLVQSEDPGYKDRIRSGIGDLLSNLTALLDWKLAAQEGREEYESHSGFQARCGAELILYQLRYSNDTDWSRSEPFLEDLACGLISSAEAMARYGSSRPASGFEHKFYHALSSQNMISQNFSHGVAVSVGALISSYFHDKRLHGLLKDVNREIGLPYDYKTLEQVGITYDAVKSGVVGAQEVKPERYTILDKIGVESIISELDLIFQPE